MSAYKDIAVQTSLLFLGVVIVIGGLAYLISKWLDSVSSNSEVSYHEHDSGEQDGK